MRASQPVRIPSLPRVPAARRRSARGFTLVELMVALVIGTLIALAAGALAISFDASRKTLVASNNANGSGAGAAASLSAQVAMAGAGLVTHGQQTCQTLYFSGPGSPLAIDPLNIVHAGAAASDVVQFAFASGGSTDASLPLTAPLTALNAPLTLSAVGAVTTRAQVLLANAQQACLLRNATSVLAGTGNAAGTSTLQFDPTDPLNGANIGAALPTFDTTSTLVPAGTLQVQQWYAQDGFLMRRDLLSAASASNPSKMADGVLFLRAQYGIDLGSGIAWSDVPAAAPALSVAQLQGLRSIRIALLARTSERERQTNPAACVTTTNPLQSLGNGWGLTVDVSALTTSTGAALVPDWKCYSYRGFTVVQPLRNVIWGVQVPA